MSNSNKIKIKSLFISDLHIGTKNNNTDKALEVLERYDYENLFIVGDLIDFLSMQKKIRWNKTYNQIIKILLNKKCNKYYITGNHEYILREYTPFKIGDINIIDEHIYKDYLIIHGDKFDTYINKIKWLYILGDYAYDIVIFLDRVFGFEGVLSKHTKKKIKQASTYLNSFYIAAEKYTKSKDCDKIICGHLHNQEYQKLKDVEYYNCGNFREDTDYIIENLDGKIEFKNE